ncbi:hypothetical protein [Aeromicrobium sp. Leaf350]|uniref:hypothetical protein n=1 Tax=Aeromicrobium sp. Leaf350 TaxID=2876565 RepID=UPI001E4D0B13|nr:hypothetical protein [Aeromicrobium sp. Leaf350]
MTSLAHVRTAVTRLDEVEKCADGGESYAVAGQTFVTVTADRSGIELSLPGDDARKVTEDIPGASVVEGGVLVPLDVMNGMQANAVIGRAWAHRAPGRLTKVSAAAASADGDLPRAIGRPATSALHGAGISTLAELSTRTESEIADLHGVGPKAMRLLGEALAAADLGWARPRS